MANQLLDDPILESPKALSPLEEDIKKLRFYVAVFFVMACLSFVFIRLNNDFALFVLGTTHGLFMLGGTYGSFMAEIDYVAYVQLLFLFSFLLGCSAFVWTTIPVLRKKILENMFYKYMIDNSLSIYLKILIGVTYFCFVATLSFIGAWISFFVMQKTTIIIVGIISGLVQYLGGSAAEYVAFFYDMTLLILALVCFGILYKITRGQMQMPIIVEAPPVIIKVETPPQIPIVLETPVKTKKKSQKKKR